MTLWQTLKAYKFYSLTAGVVLFFLLIRIPLGTFNRQSAIDAVGHVVLPAALAPLGFAWVRSKRWITARGMLASLVVIVLLGITAETLWEIVEFGVDLTWHAGWQPSNTDTMLDIISAVVGSLGGGMLFVWRDKPGRTYRSHP